MTTTIKQELLDDLLSGVSSSDDLLGDNGLFRQLKKALMERALEGELTHHLGYLPPILSDRLDPLLEPIRPLLPGGPMSFVALCTMNLLMVVPRLRHLGFLLEAAEAWFERTRAAGFWIASGIGRRIVQWFDAVILEDVALLAPAHPERVRIDRILGDLVSVGVAEAHELELKIEAAAGATQG